ncbi:hypothetical protein BH24ACT3_BH24ACT3_08810 [soil metagenome]
MDVTPRPVEERPAAPPSRRRRNRGVGVVVVLVLVAGGFILAQGLGSATTYFYNADEAIARRTELDDRRFRLQGTVVEDATSADGGGGDRVAFAVAFGGEQVDVRHIGDPPELFQVGIPVVLEGRWDGSVFASDEIMVRHSSEYEADNSDRLDEADDPANVNPAP